MMMADFYPYYFKILTITPPKVKFLTFGGTLYFRIKRFLSLKAAETKIMKKQITKWSIALVFFLQILLGNFVFGQQKLNEVKVVPIPTPSSSTSIPVREVLIILTIDLVMK